MWALQLNELFSFPDGIFLFGFSPEVNFPGKLMGKSFACFWLKKKKKKEKSYFPI